MPATRSLRSVDSVNLPAAGARPSAGECAPDVLICSHEGLNDAYGVALQQHGQVQTGAPGHAAAAEVRPCAERFRRTALASQAAKPALRPAQDNMIVCRNPATGMPAACRPVRSNSSWRSAPNMPVGSVTSCTGDEQNRWGCTGGRPLSPRRGAGTFSRPPARGREGVHTLPVRVRERGGTPGPRARAGTCARTDGRVHPAPPVIVAWNITECSKGCGGEFDDVPKERGPLLDGPCGVADVVA